MIHASAHECSFQQRYSRDSKAQVAYSDSRFSRSLFLNSFLTACSLDPSDIIVGGTPSRLKRRDRASWAWPLVAIGYKQVHPKLVSNNWEYLLPHLKTVPAISVSVNTSYGKRGYHSILSFVGRRMELTECNTFHVPHCDVFFTVRFAC